MRSLPLALDRDDRRTPLYRQIEHREAQFGDLAVIERPAAGEHLLVRFVEEDASRIAARAARPGVAVSWLSEFSCAASLADTVIVSYPRTPLAVMARVASVLARAYTDEARASAALRLA